MNEIDLGMNKYFLNIPPDERLVPFPNFAAVLMQHGHELRDKPAVISSSQTITYGQCLNFCQHNKAFIRKNTLELSMWSRQALFMLSALYHGVPVKINFEGQTDPSYEEINYSEDIPYVRLSDIALSLKTERGLFYNYDQYKICLAAQAVGKAFHLFRPGYAEIPDKITCLSDITAGFLAAVYYGKTILLTDTENLDNMFNARTQFIYTHDFINIPKNISSAGFCRDASILICKAETALSVDFIYRLTPSAEFTGLGPIYDRKGKILPLLGLDTSLGIHNEISGHLVTAAE